MTINYISIEKKIYNHLMEQSKALIDAHVLLKECLDELDVSEFSERIERFVVKITKQWV